MASSQAHHLSAIVVVRDPVVVVVRLGQQPLPLNSLYKPRQHFGVIQHLLSRGVAAAQTC